jgi:hypothetical protein
LALGILGIALAGIQRHELVSEVHVTFTSTRLVVSPRSLPPGPASVVITNKSTRQHELYIVGPGIKSERTKKVAPGSIATLALRLAPGTYKMWAAAKLRGPVVLQLVVRSSTVGAHTTTTVPRQPPTNEIAPGGVGCDV